LTKLISSSITANNTLLHEATKLKTLKNLAATPFFTGSECFLLLSQKQFLINFPHLHTLEVWNIYTGQLYYSTLYPGKITFLEEFSDGKVITAFDHGQITLWDDIKAKIFAKQFYLVRGEETHAVTLFSNGALVLAAPCVIKIYDDDSDPSVLRYLIGHRVPVRSIKTGENDSLLISSSEDCMIKIWDWNKETCLRTIQYSPPYSNQFVLICNSTFLITYSKDGSILWFDWNLKEVLNCSCKISEIYKTADLKCLIFTSKVFIAARHKSLEFFQFI